MWSKGGTPIVRDLALGEHQGAHSALLTAWSRARSQGRAHTVPPVYQGPYLSPNVPLPIPVSEPLRSPWAVQAALASWPSASFLGHHNGTRQEPIPCGTALSSANPPVPAPALTQEFCSRNTPPGTNP